MESNMFFTSEVPEVKQEIQNSQDHYNLQQCINCGNDYGQCTCGHVLYTLPSYSNNSTNGIVTHSNANDSVQETSYRNAMSFENPTSYTYGISNGESIGRYSNWQQQQANCPMDNMAYGTQIEQTQRCTELHGGTSEFETTLLPIANNQVASYNQSDVMYNQQPTHFIELNTVTDINKELAQNFQSGMSYNNLQFPSSYAERNGMVMDGNVQFSVASHHPIYRTNMGTFTEAMTLQNPVLVPMASVAATLQRIRRPRYIYSKSQLDILIKEFDADKYPSPERRRELAVELSVTPLHIKIWFQNRRQIKKKKKTGEE